MPDDPVTIGELARRIEAGFADVKDDLRELTARLDGKVSAEVFELRSKTVEDRLKSVEDAREREQRQRAQDRRWVIAAIVVPFVVLVVTIGVQVLLAMRAV